MHAHLSRFSVKPYSNNYRLCVWGDTDAAPFPPLLSSPFGSNKPSSLLFFFFFGELSSIFFFSSSDKPKF